MVSWDVEQARAFARLAQELLHDVIVRLRPVPGRLELPAVDDVPYEINGIGLIVPHEVEQLLGLAPFGSKMNVG